MSDELKPCPFCGSIPEVHYDNDGTRIIRCANTECAGLYWEDFDDITWNTRPIEDALRAKNAQLRAALEAVRGVFIFTLTLPTALGIAEEK